MPSIIYMYIILLFLSLFFQADGAYIYSSVSDWDYLGMHNVENKISTTNIDLDAVVNEEWSYIRSKFHCIPTTPKINIKFDEGISDTRILAYASSNLHLNSRKVWVSQLFEAYLQNRNSSMSFYSDITIRVNPTVPNGWYLSSSSAASCEDISYRFDLRTVLRHEILHGFGFASSIKQSNGKWSVGYRFQNNESLCYPSLYDTVIRDENNNSIVSGCNISDITNKKLFINDVQLYNPSSYKQGSSVSHHNIENNLMYFSLPAQKCIDIGEYEEKVLEGLGVRCNETRNKTNVANGATKNFNLLPIFAITILFLF